MQVYNVLKQEHDEAKDIMDNIMLSQNNIRKIKLLEELKKNILIHAKTEEEVFYERLKKEPSLKDQIEHAINDHKMIEKLFNKIEKIKPGDKRWMDVFFRIKQLLEHHIAEEEEEIFPQARKVLEKQEAEDMAEMMVIEEPEMEESLLRSGKIS
jgi:hemerythrin superfamily protein